MFHNLDIFCGVGCWLVALVFSYYAYWNGFNFMPIHMAYLALPLLWFVLFFLTLFPKRRPRLRLWWVWLSAPLALPVPALMIFLALIMPYMVLRLNRQAANPKNMTQYLAISNHGG